MSRNGAARKRNHEDPDGLLDDVAELAANDEAETTAADEVDDFAYLGREFLTWLLWQVDRGEGSFDVPDGDAARFAFGGKVRIGGIVGAATDIVLKGSGPAHGVEARA